MSKTKTFTKTFPHITGIILRTDDIDQLYLEVATNFTEKEITEEVSENESTPSKSQHRKVIQEKILKRWSENTSYPLRQVSIKELIELRLSKVPGIVYKKDNCFFYAEVPGTLTLNNGKSDGIGNHLCGNQCAMVCKGCPRTSDLTVAYQQRFGKTYPMAVKSSWRIEKYDFIREGLESFNMNSSNDAFIVLQCENYKILPKKKISKKSTADLKVGLASYVWGDFDGTRRDMEKRLRANGIQTRYDQ